MNDAILDRPYVHLTITGSITPPGGGEVPVAATLHLSVAHGSWGALWCTPDGRSWQEGETGDLPTFTLAPGIRLQIVLPTD